MVSKVDTGMRRKQAGFRPDSSCIDKMCCLGIIIGQFIEWNYALHLLFVDFEKAFDSIFRDYIWAAVRNLGMPGKIINLIQEFYNGINCQVLHEGVLSQPFESVSGVRQGCLMSPLLFLVVLDNILKTGSHVSRDGGTLGDMDRRIQKAKGTFARLKNIWRSNNISLKMKIKIFNACIKSVLLYGYQTWVVTKVIKRKLQAYVNRCLCHILRIWWPRKISNIDLWCKTNQTDINLEI
jgi:hypothetical protein